MATVESASTKHGLRRYLPIVGWLPGYRRRYLAGDILAGLVVAALAVTEPLSVTVPAAVRTIAPPAAPPCGPPEPQFVGEKMLP